MKALRNWADVTTCHGVRDTFKSQSICGKICWSLLILLFLIIMVLQLIDIYKLFNQHRWVTTVYEESLNGISEFPTITICSYNRLRQSEVIKYNLTEDNLIYLFRQMPPQKLLKGDLNANDLKKKAQIEADFVDWKQRYNMTTQQIFDEMGPRCEDIFEFIGHNGYSAYDCRSSDFLNITTVFTSEFGKCFQVNISLLSDIYYAGMFHGVSMLLNAHLRDYLNLTVANYLDKGFALQFHYGPKIVDSQWLSIAPGYHFIIGLTERMHRVRHSEAHQIWSKLFATEMFKSMPPCVISPQLKYDGPEHYSREQCQVECSLKNVIQYCGCYPFAVRPNLPMCEVEEFYHCLERFGTYIDYAEYNQCTSSCYEPCFDRRIETSMSFTGLLTEGQRNSFRRALQSGHTDIKFNDFVDDYVQLDLYFEKLAVTIVEQYEYFGFEELVSNYGGVMSLWAGVSILTLIQALAHLIHGIITKTVVPIMPSVKKSGIFDIPTKEMMESTKRSNEER